MSGKSELDMSPETPGHAAACPEAMPERPGHDALWLWFGLSYASWLTLPRVMMHAMPDDWQMQMAKLCEQWDGHWQNRPQLEAVVVLKQNKKFIKTPEWLEYRHPDQEALDGMKRP